MVTLDKKSLKNLLLSCAIGIALILYLYHDNLARTLSIIAIVIGGAILGTLFPRFAEIITPITLFLFLTVSNFNAERTDWTDIAWIAAVSFVVGLTIWGLRRKGNIALLIPATLLFLTTVYFVIVFLRLRL